MARPKKLNAEYFSHDCDMRHDLKIKNIRRRFGHEGYSLWNMLLEFLGDCDYFEYDWNEQNIELLEPDFDMDADRIKEIVNRCIELDLLQLMNGMLTCDRFTKRLVHTLSPKRSDFSIENATRFTRERDKAKENSIKGVANAQSKGEESKGEESIAQNRTLYESIVDHSKVEQSVDNFSTDVNGTPLGGVVPSTAGVGSVDVFSATVINGLKTQN